MSISVGQVKGNPKEAAELIGVLEAEIERLRAALGQIAGKNNLEGVPQDDCPSAAYAALHECEVIARDALDPNQQKAPSK